MPALARLIFIALFAAPPALAQSDNAGRLDAFICGQLPAAPRIDVQLLDDAPRHLPLRDKFITQMKKNGIEVMAGAPLILMLDIGTVREFSGSDRGQLGELRVGRDGGVSLRGKFWSSSDDSILGGRKRTTNRLSVDRLRVSASLNGRADGRCIWRGEFIRELDGRDPHQAAQNIMPILADAIGRSAQNRSVKIPE